MVGFSYTCVVFSHALVATLLATGCLRSIPRLSDAGAVVVDSGPVNVATLPFPMVPRFDAGEPAFQLTMVGFPDNDGGSHGELNAVFAASYKLTNIERFGTELPSACALTDDPTAESNTTENAGTVTVAFTPNGCQYEIPYGAIEDAGAYFLEDIQSPPGSTLHFSNSGSALDGGTIQSASFVYQLSSNPTIVEPTAGSVISRGQTMRVRWTGTANRAMSLIALIATTNGGPSNGGSPPPAVCGVSAGLTDVLVDVPASTSPGTYEVIVGEMAQTPVAVTGFTNARVVEWAWASATVTVQ